MGAGARETRCGRGSFMPETDGRTERIAQLVAYQLRERFSAGQGVFTRSGGRF